MTACGCARSAREWRSTPDRAGGSCRRSSSDSGSLLYLLRYGRRYDVVHTSAFPYFSLLAAGVLRRLGRYDLVVDWFEVWSSSYWREYLGRAAGESAKRFRHCACECRSRPSASRRLHRDRLIAGGVRGSVTVLGGAYHGPLSPVVARPAEPVVVFAGRHIPEKRVPAIPPAIAAARAQVPTLRGEILGDGPDRVNVLAAIREARMEGTVEAPGFVSTEHVDSALGRSLCLLLPSRREGYGLVVVEAAARGTPSVVVRGEDNAATELVEDGENGVVAASASPEELAAAIVRIHAGGTALRQRTRAWFERNAHRVSVDSSLATVAAAYRAPGAGDRARRGRQFRPPDPRR